MRDHLLNIVEKRNDLPPLPESIIRLRDTIEDPDSGVAEVIQVIKADPVLSGRLIQMANNVFYHGGGFPVNNLPRALSRLGLKMALDIAYSIELPRLFNKIQVVRLSEFWKYSLAQAIAATEFTQKFGGNRDDMSHAYLGGLMNNIGILVFAHIIPEEYAEIFDPPPDMRLELAEVQKFGISHAELGSRFIEKWWPVSKEVVTYVRRRPSKPKPKIIHAVSISNLFLMAEGTPTGLPTKKNKMEKEEILKTFDMTEEEYLNLRSKIASALHPTG